MKRFLFLAAAFFGGFLLNLSANADGDTTKGVDKFRPKSESVPLIKAYVPVGFDDNDNVQITVEGEFPASCYRIGEVKKTVVAPARESEVGKIYITQDAYKYGGSCVNWPVTFNQPVPLGLVARGRYQIFDTLTKRELGKITVREATRPEADDFDYASVVEAHVDVDLRGGGTIVLTVALPDDCTKVSETLVSYHPDVLVVQPIVETKGKCRAKRRIETVEKPMIGRIAGKFLLHVRSATGGAISNLLEFSRDDI